MKEISICNILVFGYVERQDQLLYSLLSAIINLGQSVSLHPTKDSYYTVSQ